MTHEKIYGICENKCKVEVVSKEEFNKSKGNVVALLFEEIAVPPGINTRVFNKAELSNIATNILGPGSSNFSVQDLKKCIVIHSSQMAVVGSGETGLWKGNALVHDNTIYPYCEIDTDKLTVHICNPTSDYLDINFEVILAF